MKRIFYTLAFIAVFPIISKAQTTNDILNVLISNKTITQEQADSLRAEAAIKQQDTDAKKKSFPVTSGKAIQVNGYAHVRYQLLEESGKADGFDIRRAYLDVKGNLSPYWDYRLQTDFAGTPKIVDIYANLKLYDYLNITFGQQILPFSLNNVTSNTKLELADRAQSVESFAARKGDVLGDQNGRDIGITASGSLLQINDQNLIDYRIGIFNGSGINRADLNEAKDFVGRLVLHPIKGLDLGGSYYNGYTPDSASLNIKSNPKTLGVRERIGAEISYEYSIAHLRAEYITGKDGSIKKAGYYIQAGAFVIPSVLQIVGRYDTFDKNTDKDDDISTNYVAGVNLYLNKNALIQAAYTIKKEEANEVNNNFASLQLQVNF